MTTSKEFPSEKAKASATSAATGADGLDKPTANTPPISPPSYPEGLKLYTVLASVYMTVFLVALDRTIIGTAVPKITDDFHSINDVGWYASGYLLPAAAFMLIFGKLYRFYSVKAVYLCCVIIFEIGSAICGSALNSTALIVGRAVAGLGSAGLFSGTVMIMVHTIPIQRRPLFQGLFGACMGLASAVGPLLGGALTDKASWRWCFYINLPIGAFVILFLVLFLHTPSPPTSETASLTEHFLRLDPIGTLIFLPGTTLLLLALQWGGTTHPWSSVRVVTCLVLAFALLVLFIAVQVWKQDAATVPPRIITQRSVGAAVFYTFMNGASMQVVIYYIPIWFQAVQGVSAVDSGIRTLGLVLPMVVASAASGIVCNRIGHYAPQMILGSIITSVGAGMLTMWQVRSSAGQWIGYQVLYGFGMGLGLQAPGMAVQTTLSRKDIPTGTALMFFTQMIGGAVFVSAAQNIFASKLRIYLTGIPGIDAAILIESGATALRRMVDGDMLAEVLKVFNTALTKTFYVAVAVSIAGIVGALCVEWNNVKNGEGQGEKKRMMKKSDTEANAERMKPT
ncbi:major facilitator superfamily transporter [Polyplosphaeria fusca]|uniref:Major facilitator superfamily transporter n=1 Tax=Polyplosphaeria fusca TaxID=682080 RepID=A0A9P4RB34_9PLEO|nr:major facilitator superfamily transporter [Polyplosphaeria fusca]